MFPQPCSADCGQLDEFELQMKEVQADGCGLWSLVEVCCMIDYHRMPRPGDNVQHSATVCPVVSNTEWLPLNRGSPKLVHFGVVQSLMPTRSYIFRARSRNGNGVSVWSSESLPVTMLSTVPSAVPHVELVSVEMNMVTLRWMPCKDDGGLPVSKYEMVASMSATHDSRCFATPRSDTYQLFKKQNI